MCAYRTVSLITSMLLVAATMQVSAQSSRPVTSADEVMALHPRVEYKIPEQPQWIRGWAPSNAAVETSRVSADLLLDRVVASYVRTALDRGGWTNPWVAGSGYSSGHPLQAVPPGDGVTSGGFAAALAPLVLALRQP